jgi:hypothetical protein
VSVKEAAYSLRKSWGTSRRRVGLSSLVGREMGKGGGQESLGRMVCLSERVHLGTKRGCFRRGHRTGRRVSWSELCLLCQEAETWEAKERQVARDGNKRKCVDRQTILGHQFQFCHSSAPIILNQPSTFNTKHLLPAWPRSERIPQHSQLGFRRRRGRCRPGSVQAHCRQRKHNIFSECKPSTYVFFKPGNCLVSAVSSTAPRQNHEFVQPCCEVQIYNRYLFPYTRKARLMRFYPT